MAHSKSKNWIHLIFGTKNRTPFIDARSEPHIHEFLKKEFVKCNCFVDCINGFHEHVHVLFLLNPQHALSNVIKQVKGASSHTINQSDLFEHKFAWATGNAAYSVSESGVEAVRSYIQNQKQHHRKQTYQEEFEAFLKLHGLS